jgi:Protein of unknown function (DUF1236)
MLKRSLISIAALAATSGLVFAADPSAQPGGSNKANPGPAAASPSNSELGGASGAGKVESGKTGETMSKGATSDDMKSGDMKSGDMKSGDTKKSGDMKAGDNAPSKSGDMKSGENSKSGDMKSGDKQGDMKSGEKAGDMKSGDMKSGEKAGDMKSGSGKNAETKGDSNRDKAALAKVTPEQKTQVKSVFTKHRVEPAKIGVSVNVGVAIPRETRLYSVPQDILVIAPAYREYRYFIVDDRVCIVDPDTFEIVDIIILA